jgi:hypothetical protein
LLQNNNPNVIQQKIRIDFIIALIWRRVADNETIPHPTLAGVSERCL